MRTKVITAVAVVAAIASAALTLLPWVDVSRLGLPIRWNGLGIYIGEYGETYGHLLAGMVNSVPGWIVLIASLAAAAAVLAAARVRALGLVACGCAIVAFVTAVVCLVYPAVLAGDTKNEMGISLVPDRQVLNSGALIAEAAATGVLLASTALLAFRRKSVDSEEDEVFEGD
ncbi:hypothetical protein BST14_04585 [Mycobacterium arosiense ATCC BAA-1401 = DSM 45069]|uniref:Uncharacterized protein n=1 Tax=Mycobacterium arosiense ATCC BAA-1401 = DSM 45069 TaxID=1265311 RepID=A0A1W9ZPJ2_MYCAI|nr:hypothetical protein BST14_04585 [Mycobacterium arosiense ATCC BAA-1401 = DSM 45069]